MSLQQIFGISRRMGKQIMRSKWTIPYLLLFPGFFIMIYWFGFSTSEIGANRTYMIGIVNEDSGFPMEIQNLFQQPEIQNVLINNESGILNSFYINQTIEKGFSFHFISVMEELQYAGSADSNKLFEIEVYDNNDKVNDEIKNRRVDAVIEISNSFTMSVLSIFNHYWELTEGIKLDAYLQSINSLMPEFPNFNVETITVRGDSNHLHFIQAKALLEIYIDNYFSLKNYFPDIGGDITFQLDPGNEVSIPTYSVFEILLPGIIIFGIIIQPSLFAAFLSEEFRPGRRTFERIKVAPVGASTYIIGTILIQIPLMMLQTLTLFIIGILLGANFIGNLLLAYLIAISLLPFIAALNFIAAAYLNDEDSVGMVYGFGSPILGFASGSFTVLPHIVLFHNIIPYPGNNKRDFLIWDILPTTHISNAVRNVLLWDHTFNDVITDILMNLVLSFVFLIFSIYVFNSRRFKGEGL